MLFRSPAAEGPTLGMGACGSPGPQVDDEAEEDADSQAEQEAALGALKLEHSIPARHQPLLATSCNHDGHSYRIATRQDSSVLLRNSVPILIPRQ